MPPDGWKKRRVDELKAPIESAIAIGPFGSSLKTHLYTEAGVPVIRGSNITEGRHLAGEFVFVDEATADRLRSSNVSSRDLVFPHRGAIGQVAIVPDDQPRYQLSTSLMKLSCDRTVADPLFLFYFFRSPSGRHELLKHASTVGTPGIGTPLTSLRSIEVPLPPLSEQRVIGALLGALDDKIDLNRRMNETLDALCRTLFTGVAGGAATAQLGDLVEINARKRDRAYPHDAFEYVEISAVNEGRIAGGSRHLTRTAPGRAQRLVRDGDTIWSCVRPNRRAFAFIDSPPDDLVVSTGFATLTPIRVPPAYLYFAVTSDEFVDHLTANADGSAYPAVKPEHFVLGEIPLASDEEIGAFEAVTRPALARSAHDERESRTLAALRDALLPKLISGELRIRAAERIVEEEV